MKARMPAMAITRAGKYISIGNVEHARVVRAAGTRGGPAGADSDMMSATAGRPRRGQAGDID
jgi:hypothetical protein